MNTDQKIDETRRDAVRQMLLEEVRSTTKPGIVTGTQHRPLVENRQGRPQRGITRRALLLSTAAAAIVAGMVAVDVIGPSEWSGGASAEAAEFLENAAVRTIHAVDPAVPAGQYLKVSRSSVSTAETVGSDGVVVFVHVQENTNTYIPGDPAADWVLERTEGHINNAFGISPDIFAQLEAEFDYEDSLLRAKNGEFYGPDEAGPNATPTPKYLATLPRDPQELLEVIRTQTKGKGQSPSGQVLVFLSDLLRTHQVPADLRAALFRATALVPGIEVTARQATVDDRVGTAIGYLEKSSNVRHEVIIDPNTGMMIGDRSVKAEGDVDFPTNAIMGWSSTKVTVAESAP